MTEVLQDQQTLHGAVEGCRSVQEFEVLSSPSAESTSLTLPSPRLLFQLWLPFVRQDLNMHRIKRSIRQSSLVPLFSSTFNGMCVTAQCVLPCSLTTHINLPVVYITSSISSFPISYRGAGLGFLCLESHSCCSTAISAAFFGIIWTFSFLEDIPYY